jgi:hypothetical protein
MIRGLRVAVAVTVIATVPPTVYAQQSVHQYRAALTEVFLERYRALAVVRLNPVFPGDVLELRNETRYSSYKDCYDALPVGQVQVNLRLPGRRECCDLC